MITGISKVITNPALVNISQNTNGTVVSKTLVNAVGRPGFILIDNHIDNETKKNCSNKRILVSSNMSCCLSCYNCSYI